MSELRELQKQEQRLLLAYEMGYVDEHDDPETYEQWREELAELQSRIDALETAQR